VRFINFKDLYFNVGVVGYSSSNFDVELATKFLTEEFDKLFWKYAHFVNIVSGYTNLGVPGIAYKISEFYDFKTTGIACKRATEYDLYPVDSFKLVGNEWGEESETFLSSIDMLIRVGGGKQSLYECKLAKERNLIVVEYDL